MILRRLPPAAATTLLLALPGAARAQAPPQAPALTGVPALAECARGSRTLAFSAAMEGRKADTLAAVQSVVQTVPLDAVLGMGDSGWILAQQYAALVRFGLWDEAIALGPPDARAPGLTAAWLYSRGVALAARGQIAEARTALRQLQQLAAGVPADLPAGLNTLHAMLAVAEPIVAARIAATEQRNADALTLLRQAVAAQDRLGSEEPADWFFPARHLLGAQLLIAGQPAQAEAVYREDLARNPSNGWALYGLAAALRAQGKAREAARVTHEFEAAWQHADVRLLASAFWFGGADTTSCECQRSASGDGQSRGELLGAQHEAGVH